MTSAVDGACLFPACVQGDRPPYCGDCENRPTRDATGTTAVFTVRVWPEDDHVVMVCDVGIFRAPTVPEVLRDVASAYQIAEEARRV